MSNQKGHLDHTQTLFAFKDHVFTIDHNSSSFVPNECQWTDSTLMCGKLIVKIGTSTYQLNDYHKCYTTLFRPAKRLVVDQLLIFNNHTIFIKAKRLEPSKKNKQRDKPNMTQTKNVAI